MRNDERIAGLSTESWTAGEAAAEYVFVAVAAPAPDCSHLTRHSETTRFRSTGSEGLNFWREHPSHHQSRFAFADGGIDVALSPRRVLEVDRIGLSDESISDFFSVMQLALSQSASCPSPVDWKAMVSAIREVLHKEAEIHSEFSGIENLSSLAISKTTDITGDGIPEALVDLGTGGASADETTVMRMEKDKPVLAVFKRRDGKLLPMTFLEGASVMHTGGIELLPEKQAVYSFHYKYSESQYPRMWWRCRHLEQPFQNIRLRFEPH